MPSADVDVSALVSGLVKDTFTIAGIDMKDNITASELKVALGLDKVTNVSTNDQIPTFIQASTRTNIVSGEKLSVLFGKIMKWFADLKTVAFSGSYSDLSNKPIIPTIPTPVNNLLTTVEGQPLDAVQGKVLNDKISDVTDSLGDKIVFGNDGSTCKLKVFSGFTGATKANQCVKFGNIQVPEDGTVIRGIFLTPFANGKYGINMYTYPESKDSWAVYCESNADIASLQYNCMIVYI